jgi:hypothetical protein
MLKGTHMTEEARKHCSEGQLGRPIPETTRLALLKYAVEHRATDETKAKMSLAQRGHPDTRSEEGKERTRQASLNRHIPCPKETKEKIAKAHMGFVFSVESRAKMSASHMGKRVNRHREEYGMNQLIRMSREYAVWRTAVFSRDGFICQGCGDRQSAGHTVILEAHHMDGFADFPEKRLDADNGITLCRKCHQALHRRYGTWHNRKWQIDELLTDGWGQAHE